MTKKILILNGNPKAKSYDQHLADRYEVEAREYYQVKRFDLSELDFNPSLENGYDSRQPLEDALVAFQEALLWAEHVVILTPVWWGGLPAKLKGLFDRTFLPGFAFQYSQGSVYPEQLLKGKTSRLIITMDAPEDFAQEQANPIIEQLDKFTLQFSGIEAAELTLIGSIIMSDTEQRTAWDAAVSDLGKMGG